MDALDAILTRRSIRRYSNRPIDAATLTKLLKSAMAAPSAGNGQPWHFVVIDDRALLDRIPSFHPYAQMLAEAPLAIAVCGDTSHEKHPGYWVQDCSAATENLLLAAHALGLGAVWLGVYPRDDRVAGVRNLLSLPNHIHPLCLIALGHPAETKPRAERYDAARVRRNGW